MITVEYDPQTTVCKLTLQKGPVHYVAANYARRLQINLFLLLGTLGSCWVSSAKGFIRGAIQLLVSGV